MFRRPRHLDSVNSCIILIRWETATFFLHLLDKIFRPSMLIWTCTRVIHKLLQTRRKWRLVSQTSTSLASRLPHSLAYLGDFHQHSFWVKTLILNQLLSRKVTDAVDHIQSVAPPKSRQEQAMIQSSSETAQPPSQMENPVTGEKRRRPKYSLKRSMLRKHPVLKFSATGPLDRELSPY